MKRFSPCIRAAVACAVTLSLPVVSWSAEGLDAEYLFLEELFPTTPIDSAAEAPIDGFVEMKVGGDIFYVSKDGRYLIQGDIYDVSSKLNLTENSKADSRKAYATRFGDDESIVFAAENPRVEVVVFTDIDCGYCRKLHRQIDEYNQRGISIRYLFFPRSGPGSDSWKKAEQVWCAKSRKDALTRAKNNEAFESADCDASIVAEHYAVVNELGLSGTPAILLQDGTLMIGYRSPDELVDILGLDSAEEGTAEAAEGEPVASALE